MRRCRPSSIGADQAAVDKTPDNQHCDQRPDPGSADEHVLRAIYDFYSGQNHRFEWLAARVVERILSGCGGDFRLGWVTPPSSDGGADFVGRLDIGSGFSRVKQVVFGQAKC